MLNAEEAVCSATLIVFGEDVDPEAVTGLLQMDPSQAWRKGEQKSYTRSDGTVRQFNSFYEWGGWR